MRLPLLPLLLPMLLPATPALSDAPQVVTDTAPVHALVSLVMGDLGQPAMLLPPGTSPHDAALRPSDAAGLEGADVVIWTGPGLVPQLEGPVATLAPDAAVLELLETPGWTRLPLRDDADFAAHDHGADDHAHDHGATDPHAWLDPAVAAVWVAAIADTLAGADPANAAAYAANAQAAATDLAALRERLAADLLPLHGRAYLVPHDAYQYFEAAFGLPASGAIALSDAQGAGPAHVAELQARIAAEGIGCVLTDPQTPPGLVALVAEGSALRCAEADPDGQRLAPGPGLYAALVAGVAAALRDCLG